LVDKKKFPIRWDRLAKDNLDAIYDYIAEDSVLAARKVKFNYPNCQKVSKLRE